MTLAEMKNIDPRTVDKSKLTQRASVRINPKATQREKIAELLKQMNPYCYLDGDTVVITRFKETEVSINDCYFAYLGGVQIDIIAGNPNDRYNYITSRIRWASSPRWSTSSRRGASTKRCSSPMKPLNGHTTPFVGF